MSSTSPLLLAENISRRYGQITAVDSVSLSLARGEVLGLLGLNGAGKSTTLGMLSGVLAPSSGWIRIGETDLVQYPDDAKARLGYLPDTPPLYPELGVREYLLYAAKLRRVPKSNLHSSADRALELCQLQQVSKRLLGNLSKGYRQRVGLAQALIHEPELLILDEPSSGLDPVQLMDMRKLISQLSGECGIILSTHILAEVTAVCNRVAILHEGCLIHEEDLNVEQTQGLNRFHLILNQPVMAEELLSLDSVHTVENTSDRGWLLNVPIEKQALVINEVCARGWQVLEFTAARNNLEERFASLTVGSETHAGAKR